VGTVSDLSWLKASLAPAEYAKLEEANTDRPKQQGEHGQTVFFVKRLAGLSDRRFACLPNF
jgi:hypothetical protein